MKHYFKTLTLLLFFVSLYIVLYDKGVVYAQSPELTCKVKTFLVPNNYQLPYRYDTTEVASGSKLNPGNHFVYVFEILSNDSASKKLTKVTTTHVNGQNEPIEVIQVHPLNGNCTTDSNKSISCDINYTFYESAHFPIEYHFKLNENTSTPSTSTMFKVETSQGNATCASWHAIQSENKPNPVGWSTPYAKFSSSDFYIKIGDKKFYSKNPIIKSDPGTERTTLEATWQENGVEMRLFMYFRMREQNEWEMYDMRTYDGQLRGEWLYYKESLGNEISSIPGQRNYAYERTFKSTDGKGEIYCKSCEFNVFMSRNLPVSASGYILEPLIGLPTGEIITLMKDTNSGYGVNVLLQDSSGNVVKDQSGFTYEWTVANPSVVKVDTSLNQQNNCFYGINPPCPALNGQIKALDSGQTAITVRVRQLSDNAVIAQTTFPVKVIDKSTEEKLSEKVIEEKQDEFKRLEDEVKELRKQVEEQRTIIQRLVDSVEQLRNSIKGLFARLFRR